MLSSVTALFTIIIFAFGLYALTGISRRIAPLVGLVLLCDVAMVRAMGGGLYAGTLAVYVIAAVVFALALYTHRKDLGNRLKGFFAPGVVLFVISSAVMLLVLRQTQPVMHGWDEFSFWGTSQKLVKQHNALYTYYSSSMLGKSIPPSMAVLTYFFGFASGSFVEWVCYFAYDVLFFACFAAFTAVFDEKQPHSAFMLYTAAFMIPFIFEITEINSKLYSTYISAYGDIPLALVFAGAVAVYFCTQHTDSRRVWPVLPVLVFLTLIKDMGLALSCIAAFVIFFDMVVGIKEFSFVKIRGFFGKCAAAASMLAVTGISYIGWSVHLAKVLTLDRSDFGGSSGMGMGRMLIAGVKALLGIERDRKFREIFASMISAFFNLKVSMFGSGLMVVAVITAVFAAAFILGDKKGRIRTATAYITTWIGFIGYYVFHIFLYVYVFRNDAYTLPSYDRYMYTFYIGWLCIGLFCLALAVKDGHRLLSRTALFGFAAGCLLIVSFYADRGNTFIGVNRNSFPKRELIRRKAEFLQDAISSDDVIYIGSEDNSGEHWFIYTYELADNKIVQDYFVWDGTKTEDEWDEMAPAVMTQYFKDKGVTHFLIDNVNEEFIQRYGDRFDVPVDEIGLNYVAYYKVNYNENGFYFTFVKGGAA